MDDGALTIGPDDPRTADVQALIGVHLGFATATSPPEHVFALGVEGLLVPSVTLLAARRDGVLLGIAALKVLDAELGEVKSMHTAAAARGGGVGAALLARVVDEARGRGLRRLSLETGTQPEFAPAHRLYARAGFVECGPFADYPPSEHSRFFTLVL